jgi:hypothetical protein
VWAKRFGDAQDQIGAAVGVDRASNIYVTGTMHGTVDFGEGPLVSSGGADLFLAKFAP